jgi:hypothetical protein
MRLAIFDFDFTLAKTVERVKLWTPKGKYEQNGEKFSFLSPKEYNLLKMEKGDYLNDDSFQEFTSVDCGRAIKIEPTFVFFEKYLNDPNTIVNILSSRPQAADSTALEFLRKSVEKNNIEKINDVLFKGCNSSHSEDKYNFIFESVTKNPVLELVYFDDSSTAVGYVGKNFSNDFKDIKLTTCLVKIGKSKQSYTFKDYNYRK